MTEWQPIETAPTKDSGYQTTIDLYAKRWVADKDNFEFRRFPECEWSPTYNRPRLVRNPLDATAGAAEMRDATITGSYYVRVSEDVWKRLGAEAVRRGMSRPKLAVELLGFLLDDPAFIDNVLTSKAIK